MPRIKLSSRHLMFITSALVITFLCTVIGLVFIGKTLYANVQQAEQKLAEESALRNKQIEESQALITAQKEALEQAQKELALTKTNAAKTSDRVNKLQEALKAETSIIKDVVISSGDLAPYVTGVVQIMCGSGNAISSGSGTLWSFKELPHAVVTNYHVVKDATNCVVAITNSANTSTGIFALEGSIYTLNKETDTAIIGIGKALSSNSVPIANYNYALSKVRSCPRTVPVGSPVVIIGYPAYAKRNSTLTIEGMGTVNVVYRTVTNGILSGYDTSLVKGDTVAPNFFVSAKIDSGNSGGMSLAKDANGICVLGLPTWLTVGNYETQGLIQNIANVLP